MPEPVSRACLLLPRTRATAQQLARGSLDLGSALFLEAHLHRKPFTSLPPPPPVYYGPPPPPVYYGTVVYGPPYRYGYYKYRHR
jgi:hypothetical protein